MKTQKEKNNDDLLNILDQLEKENVKWKISCRKIKIPCTKLEEINILLTNSTGNKLLANIQ